MKKVLLFAIIFVLSISLFGCMNQDKPGEVIIPDDKPQQTDESDELAVMNLVKGFGSKLQLVSLLAPKDILSKSIQDNYTGYVSPTLIAEWISNPLNAPGRLTSSPWPDRIEILSIDKISEKIYHVKGEIIELINSGQKTVDIAAKRPITLTVKKMGNDWLIDAVTLGSYENANAIVYENTEYGFSFRLPESWKGYSIVTDKWVGTALEDSQTNEAAQTGPIISIRHPQWTSQNQRQDIPIMIFTLDQWNLLQQEKFHIGAAPFGPSELGRNTKYVFALPARYNYAFPTGFEEVEDILKSNPLQINK
jgi:hypothetical protein